jgi:hypothetical protein
VRCSGVEKEVLIFLLTVTRLFRVRKTSPQDEIKILSCRLRGICALNRLSEGKYNQYNHAHVFTSIERGTY